MFKLTILAPFFIFLRLSFFLAFGSPLDSLPAQSQPFLTASQEFTSLTTPPFHLLTIRARYHAYHFSCFSRQSPVMPFLLLCGDIEINPGPSNGFTVCTLNIRSLLNHSHHIDLVDLADSHHPDLFCLTETWIKPCTTSAELIDSTVPGYSLLSYPRTPRSPKSSQNVGGGTAFLVKTPFNQAPSTIHSYCSFEASAITLKLRSSKLTVFNLYRPPISSNYAKPFSTFLDEFHSFLCSAATTPHEFLITGDFNIHVDDPLDSQAIAFLSLLSDTNLTQHVSFPTQHPGNHTLDLVITPSDSSLNPKIIRADTLPSDHYPVFSYLSISPNPPSPPQPRTYRRLHLINPASFLDDLMQTSLITNPPQSLSSLIDAYDSTVHSLLDKHAPLVTKTSARHSPSQPWFTDSVRSARSACRRAESVYRSTHYRSTDPDSDYSIFKRLRNQYHKSVLAAKKAYYSSLVKSSADNPRRQWNTINNILHRRSETILPSSVSLSALATQFATFFKDKISQLRLSLSASPVHSPHYPPPPTTPPDFSDFPPATVDEIIKLIRDCPDKQSSLDALPTSLLKHCSHVLAPIITRIVNLSLAIGEFCPQLKRSIITPLLKKPSLDKDNLSHYRPISNLSVISKITKRIVKVPHNRSPHTEPSLQASPVCIPQISFYRNSPSFTSRSGGYRGGSQGRHAPYKPMSGRRTSCSRRKDKCIMGSSYKLNVANA